MAILAGVESAVQIHIERGDDLNAYDGTGNTPLMLSAARNKAAICKLLLAAGADAELLDSAGRNSLDIAKALNAHEAVSVIEAVCRSQPILHVEGDLCELVSVESERQEAQAPNNPDDAGLDSATTEPSVHLPKLGLGTRPAIALAIQKEAFSIDIDECDLSDWEAESERPAPEDDSTISSVATRIQSAITDHQPIDTSADWEDFDAFLPDRATLLSRSDDTEARERLRLVLLRAIREGSVPYSAIEDLTLGDDGEPDREAVALLSMVINDLGAETDERLEYSTPYESFEVFVGSDEDPDEADEVAAALMFMDDWMGRRNEPLRIYQREFQRAALLTAEAEVALGQAMESSIEKALDALAAWPSGVVAILDAAREVASGAKPLRWLSSGSPTQTKRVESAPSIESGGESDLTIDFSRAENEEHSEPGRDSNDSSDELAEFCSRVAAFSELTVNDEGDAEWDTHRSAIASLCLTREFLMGLAASRLAGECEAARAFVQEIHAYRCARDQMTVANLKLVFSIAKKYLFSGEPLDDLLQEGNIGLIKAVDRYDWRRGFKFSTYATWWIRQRVARYVADKSKTIRLPVHIYQKCQRIAQAARVFELEHRYQPTAEQLAALVELPGHKVVALSRASLELLPLLEIDDMSNRPSADAAEQLRARDPIDTIQEVLLARSVERILSTLPRRDANILRMRFGIGAQDAMNLAEIATRIDVTRERVRQIEAGALRRLKEPALLAHLSPESSDGQSPRRAESTERELNTSPVSDGDARRSAATIAALQLEIAAQQRQMYGRERNTNSESRDALLDYARAVGAEVVVSNHGGSQRIWIGIGSTPEKHSRTLVRKLTEHGFESQRGGHYWQ